MPPAASRRDLPGDPIELADDDARSAAWIEPTRGALVSRFQVDGRELLYLDEATLRDASRNVRGGIPILFPSPGRLTGDRYVRDGSSGAMKQHGFARDSAWQVRQISAADAACASLVLEPTAATRAVFPWDFRVEATFRLSGRRLRLTLRVDNPSSDRSLPFALGFHPYFRVVDKARARIATRATRALDNRTGQVVPFRGFDLTGDEVDLHLIDHGSSASELDLGDGARLALRASPELTRWVVWTLPGKDYVCVEPWSAPANALNTGEGLIELAPLASRELWFEIEQLSG